MNRESGLQQQQQHEESTLIFWQIHCSGIGLCRSTFNFVPTVGSDKSFRLGCELTEGNRRLALVDWWGPFRLAADQQSPLFGGSTLAAATMYYYQQQRRKMMSGIKEQEDPVVSSCSVASQGRERLLQDRHYRSRANARTLL